MEKVNTIVFLFMVAAAVVLVIGVIAMAINGKFNKKNSNNLMRLRVLFQSIALAIVVLLVLMTT